MKRRFVGVDEAVVVVSSAGPAGPNVASGGGDDVSLAVDVTRAGNGDLLVARGGVVRRVVASAHGDVAWVDRGGARLHLRREDERRGGGGGGGGAVASPMTGRVVVVHAVVGAAVQKGDVLVVIEAMKMEQPLVAPRDGVVAAVRCEAGQLVDGGVELVTLAAEAKP